MRDSVSPTPTNKNAKGAGNHMTSCWQSRRALDHLLLVGPGRGLQVFCAAAAHLLCGLLYGGDELLHGSVVLRDHITVLGDECLR